MAPGFQDDSIKERRELSKEFLFRVAYSTDSSRLEYGATSGLVLSNLHT
jgi:hypothetical protein